MKDVGADSDDQDYKYLLVPPNPFKNKPKPPPYVPDSSRVSSLLPLPDIHGVFMLMTNSFFGVYAKLPILLAALLGLQHGTYSLTSTTFSYSPSRREPADLSHDSIGDVGWPDLARDHHHRRSVSPRRDPAVLCLRRPYLLRVRDCSVRLIHHHPHCLTYFQYLLPYIPSFTFFLPLRLFPLLSSP